MKILTPISSGKFEFMSGKCQGILFCLKCGNPELLYVLLCLSLFVKLCKDLKNSDAKKCCCSKNGNSVVLPVEQIRWVCDDN